MLILEENGQQQNLPDEITDRIKRKHPNFDGQQQNLADEITDWIKGHFSTFESWHKKLVDMQHPDIKSLTADQTCQRIIDVFEGVELVMSEANKLPKRTSLEGKENSLFDFLISALQITYEHYNHMQDFLRH